MAPDNQEQEDEVKDRSAGLSIKGAWWGGFDKSFRPVFNIISAGKTNAQARYIIKKLNLRPGRSFLDCPSGIGRISLPLAQKGIRVTAVDLVPSYLEELTAKARRRKLRIATVQSDMRQIDFRNQFDAAGNIWTSFGFFEKEADNQLVLKRMFLALKPGGKFMLHLINRDWIMANFMAMDGFEVGKVMVIHKNSFDYAASISRSVWTFVKNGQVVSHNSAIRMYSYHELRGMFAKAGFVDIEGFGTMKDTPITHESRMMFIIGTKPK